MWFGLLGHRGLRGALAITGVLGMLLLVIGIVSPVPINLQGKWQCAGPGYNMQLELTRNSAFLRDASGRPMLLQANGEVKANITRHATYLLTGASSQYVLETSQGRVIVQKDGSNLKLFQGLYEFSRCGSIT